MKLSDYVIKYLENYGVEDVFLLSGGGMMHLLNSLAESKIINKYYSLHEQAAGFAADGYAQYKGKLGVCFVTTGPGATNVITPLASSYIDSTPILYISGQVKTTDITKNPEVRQTGAQEVGIISIVQSITKYAVTITDADTIRYHLEKALYLCENGRPGPVWIDIPLDIQAMQVNEEKLQSFLPDVIKAGKETFDFNDIAQIYGMIKESKRPCILAGTGIMLSGARDLFIQLVNKLSIPVVISKRAKRIFNDKNSRFNYGIVGGYASRSSNYVLQNCDLLLVIGSGLRCHITAYNEENFAPNAKKVIINIHEAEIDKLRMSIYKRIVCSADLFIREMISYNMKDENIEKKSWIEYCDNMRSRYQIVFDNRINYKDGNSYEYIIAYNIYKYSKPGDVFVASPSAFGYIQQGGDLKDKQDFIMHLGLGSMGTGLPEAIGVCIASGRKRTILCEGDGSLQHNIQEISLLKHYNLPIKLFVYNNNGYGQIYVMQKTHFNSNFAGCNEESGISFPDLEKLAVSYDISYVKIGENDNIDDKMEFIMSNDKPMIIEFFSSIDSELLPITKSRMLSSGEIRSTKLEELYPFLSDEEHNKNMTVF